MIRKKKAFFFKLRIDLEKDASHLSVPVLGLDVVCKSLGLLVGGVAVAVVMAVCTIQVNTHTL
jgi:hypothetical protein